MTRRRWRERERQASGAIHHPPHPESPEGRSNPVAAHPLRFTAHSLPMDSSAISPLPHSRRMRIYAR